MIISPEELLYAKKNNIPAYVFDIDNTLANMMHRFHHITECVEKDGIWQPRDCKKNWEAFEEESSNDEPIEHMVTLFNSLFPPRTNKAVMFCTGRSESIKGITYNWLKENVNSNIKLDVNPIYMRPLNDKTEDGILKVKLIKQIIDDGFYPEIIFDDRKKVVDAYRKNGLIVFHVAEGEY